jgi:hypothetical protein
MPGQNEKEVVPSKDQQVDGTSPATASLFLPSLAPSRARYRETRKH